MFIQKDRLGAAACTMLAVLLVLALWVTASSDLFQPSQIQPRGQQGLLL